MSIPAIDQLDASQSGKEATINELFDSLRAFFTLQIHRSASVGLGLVLYGGRFNGTDLADQSLTLPASSTSYVEADASTGVVSSNTSSYSSGKVPLGRAVTSGVGLTSYTPEAAAGGSGGTSSAGIPQVSKSTAYTTVLADANKHILHPSADTTGRTITIDSNANVAYPIGTALTFVNQHSAGTMTIAITSDTMRLAGAGTTGSRSLTADGIATALKVGTTEWLISGTNLT